MFGIEWVYALTAAYVGISGMLVFRDSKINTKEVITNNLPEGCEYLNKEKSETKEVYTYQAVYGVDYDEEKLSERISKHLGKHVEVLFNRTLQITVYLNELPKKVLLPIMEKDNTKIAIGRDREGIIYHNFDRFPHIVVAGTTGYGKTTFIKSLIPQLEGEIFILDLKQSKDYDNASAYTLEDAIDVFSEIDRRFYEEKDEDIFVIVDEAQEFVIPDWIKKADEKKPYQYCQRIMGLIGSQGRSNRIHLIYGTQYPTHDVIPKFVKQNAEARVIFRLPTQIASGVALDEPGAEELPSGVSGRAWYKTDKKIEIQTFLPKGVGKVANVREKEKARSSDSYSVE